MNKLILSLIAAIGFGTLPAANAESAAGETSVSAHRTAAHRTLTRKHHRHHRHHRHHHHHPKGKK